jgi:hypothetical protein
MLYLLTVGIDSSPLVSYYSQNGFLLSLSLSFPSLAGTKDLPLLASRGRWGTLSISATAKKCTCFTYYSSNVTTVHLVTGVRKAILVLV